MNPEIKNSSEITTPNTAKVVSIEIEPNSVAPGEIGLNFCAVSRPEGNDESWLAKDWDGRVGYKGESTYLEAVPARGAEDWARSWPIPLSQDEFLNIVNYNPGRTSFAEINDSLEGIRGFIALQIQSELDRMPYIRFRDNPYDADSSKI